MSSLLVHGVYDYETWQTLSSIGVGEFGFDLRARSTQLITLRDLKNILPHVHSHRSILVFEDDKQTTILSFLNILKNEGIEFTLEFRDQQEASFYQSLNHSFLWMYNPNANWREILMLKNLRGVLLPLQWKENYKSQADLWTIIEARHLEVYLHANSLSEAIEIPTDRDIKVSVDLTREVEVGFRFVDQNQLRHMKIWNRVHENLAR